MSCSKDPKKLPRTPEVASQEGGFTLPPGNYTCESIDDFCLIAKLVYAEARGEPYHGQVAVAAVLLNRLRHPDFPSSIKEAVNQYRQFEPVENGAINNTPNNKAYEAVLDAMSGDDPTDGALYFWNPSNVSKTNWVWSRKIIKRIGRHVFAV